jgi:hypothetical protein
VRAAISVFAVALALNATAVAAGGDDGARRAAAIFGSALTGGHADGLRPILPQRGKVRLTLVRMGPEEGAFGANQVEALFRDFLAGGKVRSFAITRFECDGASSALAHGKAAITDKDGRNARIGVYLVLEPEDGRWVLREVKESAE